MFGLSRLGLLGLLVLSFCALLLSEGCGAFNTDLVFQFHYPPNIKNGDGELQEEYKFTKLTLYLVDGGGNETNRGAWEKDKAFPYTEKIDCTNKAIKHPDAHLRFEASKGNKVVLIGRTSLLAACTYKTITFFMAPPGKHVAWEPYGGKNDAKQFKRIGHQVTKLPDGRLLLTGGTSHLSITQNGPSLNVREVDKPTRPFNAVVYNPATGETTKVTGLKHHRLFHSAVLIGDTILLHGGLNVEDGKPISQSEALSASSLQPTSTTITKPPRAFHQAFPTTEGQALILGQFFGGHHFANTPPLEDWRKSDPAAGRIWHTSTYIPSKDMVVMVGGLARDKDQWVPSNQIFVYNTNSKPFEQELPGKKGRFGHQTFWDKGNSTLILLGGATGDDKDSFTTSGMQDIILKNFNTTQQSIDMQTAPPTTARLFHSIVATQKSDGKTNFLLFGGTQTLSTSEQKDLASLPSYSIHFDNKVIQRSDNIKLADPNHQTAQFLSQALATNTKDVLSLGGGSLINQKQNQDNRTFLFEARTAGTFISNTSIPTEPPPTEQPTDTKTDAGPDTKPEPNVLPDITPPEPSSDISLEPTPETRPEIKPEPPVTVGEWEYCGSNRVCQNGLHCEASTQRCLKPCAQLATACAAERYCVDSAQENLSPATNHPGYCLPTCAGTPTRPATCAKHKNTICVISSASKCLRFCRPTIANSSSPSPGEGACNITDGIFGNFECKNTEYCHLNAQVLPGYGKCTPLPAKEAGKRQEGERCQIQKDPCDGSKGLYCHQDKYSPLRNICRRMCRPGNNSTCASGEECVPVFGQGKPLNAYGGFCVKIVPNNRRADEGDACDHTEQRCKNNLFCAKGICSKPCDALQKANNGCPADSDGCTCGYGFSGQASVCLPKTTSCKDDSNCSSDRQCNDGICLPPRQSAAFEKCSLNQKCIDGYKCVFGRCIKNCSPRTSPSSCPTGQTCKAVAGGILGGYCQKEVGVLEECNKSTSVCKTGFTCEGYQQKDLTFMGKCHKECQSDTDCGGIQFCESGICIGKCDPAKGVSTNSGCPLTHYCPLETPARAKAGYCVKRPTRSGNKLLAPRTCEQDTDCKKNQICIERTCLEKCFPPPLQKTQLNTACPSNTTCVAALTTEQMNERGGTCVPSPGQNDGEVCNRTDKLCVQNGTLFCGGVCYKRCDPKHPNPCGGLATCTLYRGVHVCFESCLTSATCPLGALCQKHTGAPAGKGLCLPQH